MLWYLRFQQRDTISGPGKNTRLQCAVVSPVLAERHYVTECCGITGPRRETVFPAPAERHYTTSYLWFQQKGTIHYSVRWYNYPVPEETLHYRKLWYLPFQQRDATPQCAVVYCTSPVPRLRYDRPTGSTKLRSGSEFLGELFFPSPPSDWVSDKARAVPRLFSPCQSVSQSRTRRTAFFFFFFSVALLP